MAQLKPAVFSSPVKSVVSTIHELFPLLFLLSAHVPSHAAVLEKPLEKKAGRNYGPPGSKRLIYFIDDMNMPEVDPYGTVQPHTLLRQHMDYSHWYGCYRQA